ncbi:MAG: gliding motility-associated C-terminal domain-containing protein [Bacteroidales bacterium]|nr:gliding motility-associated C-terminal domain-containing protein [Bacteroidales bacterium]
MIFNRWGQLIYENTDRNRGWNGYFKGRLCEEGVYMYRIEECLRMGRCL